MTKGKKAMDKIIINEMSFYGYHGVLPSERVQGQLFIVSLELNLDLSKAGETDALEDTIDYSAVYEEVKKLVEGKEFNLLEALAEKIAERMLGRGLVQVVTVKIKKPWAPIPGILDFVGVEIRRGKQ